MKRNVLGLILVLCLLPMLIIPVAAADYQNSHIGTYDMTGGIFYKQAFSAGTEMTITVVPTKGTAGCSMTIYTAENSLLGWKSVDPINVVPSTDRSVTTYTTTKDIDGIYFRNWSGERWTGSFIVGW